MENLSTLHNLLIIFGASALVALVLFRARQSVVIGYLVAGVLIGPHGLRLISESAETDLLAEIGIILLMFSLGIEFSLQKLRQVRRIALAGGSAQIVSTVLLAAAIAAAAGLSWRQGLLAGFVMALSSSAIVLKLLTERAETDAVHGRILLGILIFQDLCVVPMMIILPALARQQGSVVQPLLMAGIKASIILTAVILTSRLVLPRFLDFVAGLRSRELFLISIIALALATAWVTSKAGLSLALGAFLAGLVIADSQYSHFTLASIIPFRDAFICFFFISVGMILDTSFVLEHLPLVIALVVVVLVVKTVLCAGISLAFRYPLRVAVVVGLGISQIGEFSFVLLREGLGTTLISREQYQLLLSVVIVTMVLTPFLFNLGHVLGPRAEKLSWARFFRGSQGDLRKHSAVLSGHVIICGFGPIGRNLAFSLVKNGLQYVVIELNAETVRRMREQGASIFYGDATHPDILERAGIHRCAVLAITVPGSAEARAVTAVARHLNPEVFIIARTKFTPEVGQLYNAGASEVVQEELETSIEMMAKSLRKLGVPRPIIGGQISEFRREHYAGFAEASFAAVRPPGELTQLLSKVEVALFRLDLKSPLANRSIREISSRFGIRVSILAVLRHREQILAPQESFVVESGDQLAVMGDIEQIERLQALLEAAS